MKPKLKILISATLIIVFVIATIPYVYAQEEKRTMIPVTKTMMTSSTVTFKANDFTANLQKNEKFDGLIITSLPSGSDGMLILSGVSVSEGQRISATEINGLVYIPVNGEEISANFGCVPVLKSGTALPEVKVNINLLSEQNKPPEAEEIQTETQSGMTICGMLRASDPEGAQMSYFIKDEPKKGEVSIEERSGIFVYKPYAGKTGNDAFTFYAADQYGNISSLAKVKIKIDKAGKIKYADMEGSYAEFPAVKLAEEGIFVGEKIGAVSFYKPEKEVLRGEFIAMLISAANQEKNMAPAVKTGLNDDTSTPAWMKAYINHAVTLGILSGYNDGEGYRVADANRPITRGEAAVAVNSMLGLRENDTVPVFADAEAIPVWAASPTANMQKAGIIVGRPQGMKQSDNLTRAEAAVMIYNILKYDENNSGELLAWVKQ